MSFWNIIIHLSNSAMPAAASPWPMFAFTPPTVNGPLLRFLCLKVLKTAPISAGSPI